MDLLGSILNKMEKPPSAGASKEKELAKKQQENLKKLQDQEKVNLKKFREKLEVKVNTFIADDKTPSIVFEPMEKVFRAIIHDVAEVAGLTAFSFGIDNVDRHVVVYKKETVPCEEELNAMKKGEEYDPEKARLQKLMEEEEEKERLKNPKEAKVIPKSNYKEKYEHLIGKDAGKTAAHVMTSNEQFGFVPSANKRDQRSIEQTLADMAKKKKLKVETLNESNSSSNPSDLQSQSFSD